MSRRLLAGMVALGCAALLLCSVPVLVRQTAAEAADGEKPAAKEAPGQDVFGATKVWAITSKSRPGSTRRCSHPPPGSARRVPPRPRRGIPKTSARASAPVRTEFPWVQGDLSAGEKTYTKVGLRYSGEITYFASSQGLKRPSRSGSTSSPTSNKGVWWGIRPENIGPYFDAVEWDQSPRIAVVLYQCRPRRRPGHGFVPPVRTGRHPVSLRGLPTRPGVVTGGEKESPVVIPRADPKNPNQLAT